MRLKGLLWGYCGKSNSDFNELLLLLLLLFCIFPKMYGVSWGKVDLKGLGMCCEQRAILQDTCGDQTDVPIEYGSFISAIFLSRPIREKYTTTSIC